METQNFLPENDTDLQLAKQLGSSLRTGESISSIQDPLIQKLLIFKETEEIHIEDLKKDSTEIWSVIDRETQSQKNTIITPLSIQRTNAWAWATAATVLIAAFIGIFWFSTPSEPALIAQSDSTIETIILTDGSEVSLRPHSSLYKIAFSNTERAYKLDGEGFFSVAKDTDRPFSVNTNSGTITVLGTQFNVSTWGNETNVFLEEGSVIIDLDNKNSVILKPGEKATVTTSGITEPITADIEEFKDWLDNTLVIKSTPVAFVISELEHHYKVSIDISNMENETELITGSIPLADLTRTLNDLGIILGGTFREFNSNSYVFIPLN